MIMLFFFSPGNGDGHSTLKRTKLEKVDLKPGAVVTEKGLRSETLLWMKIVGLVEENYFQV